MPEAVSLARRFTHEALVDFGWERVAEEVILATSELVTNAVEHAGTDMIVAVLSAGRPVELLRVEVRDDSRGPPVPRVAQPGDAGGRGLLIVAQLSSRWGYDVFEDGKCVWFEIDAPGCGEIHGRGRNGA